MSMIKIYRGLWLSLFLHIRLGEKKDNEKLFYPWDFISKNNFMSEMEKLDSNDLEPLKTYLEDVKRIKVRLLRCKELISIKEKSLSSSKKRLGDQIENYELLIIHINTIIKQTVIDDFLLVSKFRFYQILTEFAETNFEGLRNEVILLKIRANDIYTYSYIGDKNYFGPFVKWLSQHGFIRSDYENKVLLSSFLSFLNASNLISINDDCLKRSKIDIASEKFYESMPTKFKIGQLVF